MHQVSETRQEALLRSEGSLNPLGKSFNHPHGSEGLHPFEKWLHHFFMGGGGRFKRAHVGSCSYYVGSCILFAGFCNRYGDCKRRRVGYNSLFVGCEVSAQDIASSAWCVAGAMRDVAGTR